ncbi:TRAP transporter small permease [Ferrovibrio sp.]|uniref:TRAP transporter small permease n=1 Tax=Ferrovibrio sp. TaxID=1917215 RepID=UPI0025B9E724|nr:TRAP transporter small permease [Ferrovibrio sp.]MBX3453281.1 TRAP transporter small permease [Ferrovibrio sp.]
MAENSPSQPNPFHPLRWEDWLAAIAMGLLAVITFANVLVRYLTDQSFAWTEEYSTALMLILTLAAAGAAVSRDRHIRIELFFSTGSANRQRVLALVSAAASLGAFGILTGLGVKFAYDDFQYDVTSPGIGLPQWWYSSWLPALGLAICLRALIHLIRVWRSA